MFVSEIKYVRKSLVQIQCCKFLYLSEQKEKNIFANITKNIILQKGLIL